MNLGGRLFMKYQHAPEDSDPPPQDFWESGWFVALLVVMILVVCGLFWLGLGSATHARVVRGVLLAWAGLLLLGSWIMSRDSAGEHVLVRNLFARFMMRSFMMRSLEDSTFTRSYRTSLRRTLFQILVTLTYLGIVALHLRARGVA
jgi:hypothetical protein